MSNDSEMSLNRKISENKDDEFAGYKSVDEFTKEGFKVLVEATKYANCLPADRDWNFYNTHESFVCIMNDEGDRILRLINTVLRKQEIYENIRNRGIEEQTELIVEANDTILERVANNIDEMNGLKKNPEPLLIQTVSAQLPINGSWNCVDKATFCVNSNSVVQQDSNASRSIRLLTAKNIIRPQKFFKDKIDNSNKYPWEPRIKDKPNSLKPLAIFVEETEDGKGEIYSHPYEFELEHFNPSPSQLKKTSAIFPKSLSDTSFDEITTVEQLNDLVEELRKHSEIAIDLEHHSYRTFMGITCLMQISTKNADYLIDTLSLRDKLYVLNEVFTKPSIVKIFHGADLDVQWLQRDLSLYIVNMFDTHQAAKQLEYSGLSLSYLLNRFCNTSPNKHFQLADWRIRPLPEELKTYAREDTHYLIYIYHVLKNELIKRGNGADNILRSVIQRSTDVCKKRYVKPILREDSHLDFYRKCKRLFDNKQMYALKELYAWRDTIARQEDESTGYVLPNHMLLQISDSLPREIQGILACCNPIPPLVRSNLLELHKIVLRAREQSVVKPVLIEDNRSRGSTQQFTKINIDSKLHCPHDLSKNEEFRDDLPTLLGNVLCKTNINDCNNQYDHLKKIMSDINFNFNTDLEKSKSVFSIFNMSNNSDEENTFEATKKNTSLMFLGPYERYKLVKSFVQAEEEKAATDKETDPSKKDDRSDEDRVASLHAHFMKVAKEIPQAIPAVPSKDEEDASIREPSEEQTLIAMGGTKKRKRDEYNAPVGYSSYYDLPDNELHTPLPNIHENKKQRYDLSNTKLKRRKRKRGINDQEEENCRLMNNDTVQIENGNKKIENRNKNIRNGKKQMSNYNRKRKECFINKKNMMQNRNSQQNNVSNMQEENRLHQPGTTVNPRLKREQACEANYEQNRPQEQQRTTPHPHKKYGRQEHFSPFNYAAVDFRQFQGGSSGINKTQQIRSNFKSKTKNKKFKWNNKSATFSGGRKQKGNR